MIEIYQENTYLGKNYRGTMDRLLNPIITSARQRDIGEFWNPYLRMKWSIRDRMERSEK